MCLHQEAVHELMQLLRQALGLSAATHQSAAGAVGCGGTGDGTSDGETQRDAIKLELVWPVDWDYFR